MTNRFILSLITIAFLASCSKENVPSPSENSGEIVFNIEGLGDYGTKATSSYTESQTYEKKVNRVQLLVFGDGGRLDAYKNLGESTSGSVSTVTGTKSVWAVINGPDLSSIGSRTALETKAVDLSANSTDAASGFIIAGNASVEVKPGTPSSCTIYASRLTARVSLSGITNNLPATYGSIKIKNVFLSNVVGNQNLSGGAQPSTWYNRNGRTDGSGRSETTIINGSTHSASCPSLTFHDCGQSISKGASFEPGTPYLFYTYPNASTAAPSGYQQTFNAQRTVLVITAEIAGSTYYYPVTLDKAALERNKSYNVNLSITGIGSSDPNTPVSKNSMNASIQVLEWVNGVSYDEVI